MSLRNLKVSNLMTTAVVSLKEGDTVEEADLAMRVAEFRHVPVVDDKNHVVGILSNRDFGFLRKPAQGRLVRVSEVMSRPVRTARPETSAREALGLMLEHKIGALPVIGEAEQLVGIVTDTDFLRLAHEVLSGT